MDLMILSMSAFAGAIGAPFGMLRLEPDRFFPFHLGLCASFVSGWVCTAAGAFDGAVGGGGLTEVACVETVESVSLLFLLSRLLARCP